MTRHPADGVAAADQQPVVEREPSSWQKLCKILHNHFKGTHDCEQTVNRLWTKGVVQLRPRITKDGSKVYLERWNLERLWSLIEQKDVTDVEPVLAVDPPVIVRWKGRDYRIDGRRRINQLKARNEHGPHSVLILDIGDA